MKMGECEFLRDCPFFNSLKLPSTGEMLKSRYCRGDYEKCERYKLKKAGKEVPETLWPNGEVSVTK
ncbi:MAG: hypothetical protein ACLFVI_00515 [Archaeoglobaceae archaeon]